MKRNLTAIGAALLIGLPAANAAHITPAQFQEKMKSPENAFRWAPKSKALPSEWANLAPRASNAAKAPVTETDVQLPTSQGASYLDMPDGSNWFITTEFDKQVVSQSEYYTQYDIVGVKATIYNDKYEKVGYIETEIEKPEGFSLCSSAQFGPCVTKKFFNTDDSYEIMLMANFKPEDDYGAVPFTYVFSLKGADKPADKISTLNGYYIAAVNNPTDSWSEDFFLEFLTGEELTDDEMLYTFDIYTKASYSSPTATSVKSFTVDMIHTMSDGENESMPVLIKSSGSTLYATVAQYEKTFFEDPFDFTNETLSKDNRYIVELYKKGAYDKEMTLQSTTAIPCQEAAEGFTMRSYCLGGFEGYNDITFDFGDGKTPAFIISIMDSDIYENTATMFEVYNTDAEVIKTFGEGNEGFLRLSSVPGFPEQYCMLMPTGSGDTDIEYAFFNYPAMEKIASIPTVMPYGNYVVTLSLLIDRVSEGDSYRYAAASTGGISDDNGDTSHLVAWFDHEGRYLQMDLLNGGKNINRLSPYISANGLSRYLVNTDEAREYLMFGLRLDNASGSQAHTELMIVNDRGEMLAQYPFDINATGINVAIVNEKTNPAIWITYETFEDKQTHSEFLGLPLNKFDGAGTVEDPYLLRTPGDMERIGFNLSSNFALANDIDYRGARFEPVTGSFTGSIDGAGHTIKNFALTDGAMFATVGSLGNARRSAIKNLTLRQVDANSVPAILVRNAYATDFDNVYIMKATVTGEDSDFGSIVNNAATGSTISNCAVRADIDMPDTDEVGGIVATLGNDSKVTTSSFNGTINAGSTVGGIVASGFASASIADCHIDAEITAKNTVGGVIGSSDRLDIQRCVVEGSIKATTPRNIWSDYQNASVPTISVGGIAGHLASPTVEYDDNGNPLPADPSLPPVISNCVVALYAIDIPDTEGLSVTAHRIVGRSNVNNDPAILGEEYDPATFDWVITWGEPAGAEEKISDNYVINGLPRVDENIEAAHNSTEGADIESGKADQAFFEGLGFKFDDADNNAPWLMSDSFLMIPYLHFENEVAEYFEFIPGSVSAKEGESVKVTLHLEYINFNDIEFTSSEEGAIRMLPDLNSSDMDNLVFDLTVMKEGTFTVTASKGNKSSILLVTGTSGIGNVEVSTLMSYDGSTLHAEGCTIALYNLQGTEVADGIDSLDTASLQPGVYVAVATGADGKRHTLKINVR